MGALALADPGDDGFVAPIEPTARVDMKDLQVRK
jgi:hypothetical protein